MRSIPTILRLAAILWFIVIVAMTLTDHDYFHLSIIELQISAFGWLILAYLIEIKAKLDSISN